MLTKEIQDTLRTYTAKMTNEITLVVQTGNHNQRAELLSFLNDFAKVSNNIKIEERDTNGHLRSPLSFMLEVDGKPNGIQFSGIPGGHEFNSLILAVLQSSGTVIKLDDALKQIISNLQEPLNFEIYVSLSCHNCPDTVQALNQFSIINPNISTETINGDAYPELIRENNIQGVPAIFLNGKAFANGKINVTQLLDKLVKKNPGIIKEYQNKSLPMQDVTIIGGGPAGVSAAIYAARKGLKVTMIADHFGGQVKDTMGIENLISNPETTGSKLASALQTHLNDYEITLKEHFRVEKIEKGEIKTVHLSSGEKIESRTLIIATGAKWRTLDVPGEKENIGQGVAYCPHCDGPFYKGKDIAVIGGGNSGIEAALDLAGIVNSVTVLEFSPELKADSVLVRKAENSNNINILKNVTTQEILAESGKVIALEYQERTTKEFHTLKLEGVFVQIGLLPNSQFLEEVLELSPMGEIKIDERGQTSEEGIFACGDVTTVPYKQIVIAMGEGAKASLAAFDYLLLKSNESEQAA